MQDVELRLPAVNITVIVPVPALRSVLVPEAMPGEWKVSQIFPFTTIPPAPVRLT